MGLKKTKYLLDSPILIDHLKSTKEASGFLTRQEGFCAISVITRAEVLAGLDEGKMDEIVPFLNQFPLFGIDAEIADQAARLRRQFRWKLPDAFQAAIAQANSLSFVTRDVKDFPPERYPFVTVPYRL